MFPDELNRYENPDSWGPIGPARPLGPMGPGTPIGPWKPLGPLGPGHPLGPLGPLGPLQQQLPLSLPHIWRSSSASASKASSARSIPSGYLQLSGFSYLFNSSGNIIFSFLENRPASYNCLAYYILCPRMKLVPTPSRHPEPRPVRWPLKSPAAESARLINPVCCPRCQSYP